MAEYYPLILRAVAGLERNTGGARGALYERARMVLVENLRDVKPPLSESDITRERLALEAAIRKVEVESAHDNMIEPEESLSALESSNLRHFQELQVIWSHSPHRNDNTKLVRLRRALPEQKLAPAQFEIRNGRLALMNVPSRPAAEDRDNILAARQELKSSGERILRELERSNCDKRLIETVQYVQGILSEEGNIIRLGLSNIGCGTMCSAFEAELPDAITSMLRAHTRGIELFVAQFPEWNRFVENAAQTELADSDIEDLHGAASKLIQSMQKQPELVEPEVPKTLLFLNKLIAQPGASSKRAAFAVLRSIENLISKVFAYSADFVDKTALKTIDGASTVASKALIVGLLTLALSGAASISPVAGKIGEMQWLKTAVELVQKELETLMQAGPKP